MILDHANKGRNNFSTFYNFNGHAMKECMLG